MNEKDDEEVLWGRWYEPTILQRACYLRKLGDSEEDRTVDYTFTQPTWIMGRSFDGKYNSASMPLLHS